jgi:hypothetical protein
LAQRVDAGKARQIDVEQQETGLGRADRLGPLFRGEERERFRAAAENLEPASGSALLEGPLRKKTSSGSSST